MNGIILVDKEKSWTSQDVCSKLKRALGTKKIGHTGTLDPFATGLLIITIGEGTKTSQFIESLNKSYIAVLVLGTKTSSGDPTGEVIETKDVPVIGDNDIKKVFSSLIGRQSQIPPMTSAIKVNGVPLYKLARKGQEIERKAREIEIYDLKLISFSDNKIIFVADVSKGTYIRTLGETIAEKLGTVGYLEDLRRTKVGRYLVNESHKVNDVKSENVISINESLSFMESKVVDKITETKVKNGMTLKIFSESNLLAIYNKSKELLAVYENIGNNQYKCLRGFNHESD
jgi:tRNA pseudouridine55 synthase